jgi:polyhydroxyalkanoate synthesis regulator phasin
MAETTTEEQASKTSTLGKLAERGEETLKRLSEELDKNPRMHDAKDRLDKLGRSVLHQLNVALADEVKELKREVGRLERRLAKLEKEIARGSAAPTEKGD